MAALQGGAGADPMGGMMPQGMESAPQGDAGQPAASPMYGSSPDGSNVDALRAALDALGQYAQGEDDEQNVQTVLKCVTALQAILVDEQKMVDGAMAGKADPRALRRLSGAAAGGQAY